MIKGLTHFSFGRDMVTIDTTKRTPTIFEIIGRIDQRRRELLPIAKTYLNDTINYWVRIDTPRTNMFIYEPIIPDSILPSIQCEKYDTSELFETSSDPQEINTKHFLLGHDYETSLQKWTELIRDSSLGRYTFVCCTPTGHMSIVDDLFLTGTKHTTYQGGRFFPNSSQIQVLNRRNYIVTAYPDLPTEQKYRNTTIYYYPENI